MKVITINLVFEDAVCIHKIARRLFLRYFALSLNEEKRIKFLMTQENPRDKILELEKEKFKAHENLFGSIRLGHPSDDFTKQEYFVQRAVEKYVSERKNNDKEPEIMTVSIITHEKGGYLSKVKVDNYFKNTVGDEGK